MNLGRVHNLLQRILISELTVRVVHTVAMILLSDLSEMLWASTVSLHVLAASIAKECRRDWSLRVTSQLDVLHHEWLNRVSAISEKLLQRATLHFFKTECQNHI